MSHDEKPRARKRSSTAGEQPRPATTRGRTTPSEPSFVESSSGNNTPQGAPSKLTPGYGTAQGASGATSGGADAGGSLHVQPAADAPPRAPDGAASTEPRA